LDQRRGVKETVKHSQQLCHHLSAMHAAQLTRQRGRQQQQHCRCIRVRGAHQQQRQRWKTAPSPCLHGCTAERRESGETLGSSSSTRAILRLAWPGLSCCSRRARTEHCVSSRRPAGHGSYGSSGRAHGNMLRLCFLCYACMSMSVLARTFYLKVPPGHSCTMAVTDEPALGEPVHGSIR
jgi:hypothetical protein